MTKMKLCRYIRTTQENLQTFVFFNDIIYVMLYMFMLWYIHFLWDYN